MGNRGEFILGCNLHELEYAPAEAGGESWTWMLLYGLEDMLAVVTAQPRVRHQDVGECRPGEETGQCKRYGCYGHLAVITKSLEPAESLERCSMPAATP